MSIRNGRKQTIKKTVIGHAIDRFVGGFFQGSRKEAKAILNRASAKCNRSDGIFLDEVLTSREKKKIIFPREGKLFATVKSGKVINVLIYL